MVKVSDLAEAMIQVSGPRCNPPRTRMEIVEIGTKPGENLYEELMSNEDTRRSLELREYFTNLPAFRSI